MKDFFSTASQRFSRHGWRITAHTRYLLQLLHRHQGCLFEPHELEILFDDGGHPVDRATIHRLLDRCQAAGLVHDLHGKYTVCTEPENTEDEHHYLVCKACGSGDEIFLDYEASIKRQLLEEKKFHLDFVDMVFYGTCESCTKKQ